MTIRQISQSGKNMTSHGYARNILGPDDLRLASEVFEAALSNVGESDLHPYVIRKNLAQTVMQQVFAGERDRAKLHNDALESLQTLERNQNSKSAKFIPRSSSQNVHALFAAKT